MATLIGTDYASMLNYRMKVRLFSGTREECEERKEFYEKHKEYGVGNLKIY